MNRFKISFSKAFWPFYKKMGSKTLVFALLIATYFGCFSAVAIELQCAKDDKDCIQQVLDAQQKQRDEEAEAREDERKRDEARDEARAKAEAHRAKMEDLKEQERARKEALKEMEEKCEEAAKDVEEHMKDKKEEAQDWEEKFHESNEEIAKLEEALSQKQVEIKEQIDSLQNESNKITQELKDSMDQQMKQIDSQVASLEKEIDDLHAQLEKLEDTRLTAQFARRKMQNEFYMACFQTALQKTEEARTKFYSKKQAKRVKRKTMGELITGGKQQNKSVFSAQFNNHLNLCLNNEASMLQKQGQKNEYKLQSELFARQEERAKEKIKKIRASIQKLHTTDKAEVVAKFKEKLEGRLQSFQRNYDTLSASYQTSAQSTHQQIEQIKKRQASYLQNRAQAVPQKTRSVLMSEKCSQQDTFNLFQNSGGKGLFNSSRRSATYADPDRGGGIK